VPAQELAEAFGGGHRGALRAKASAIAVFISSGEVARVAQAPKLSAIRCKILPSNIKIAANSAQRTMTRDHRVPASRNPNSLFRRENSLFGSINSLLCSLGSL
jgi:hypothetical protein